MANVRIKFKPSTTNEAHGSIIYQITHNRAHYMLNIGYQINDYEWDNNLSKIIIPQLDNTRKLYLSEINSKIKEDLKQLNNIIKLLELSNIDYSINDIISRFTRIRSNVSLFTFIENLINDFRSLGKPRSAETYTTTLNSFRRFRNNLDLKLSDIDSDIMIAYEAYLKSNGVSRNSSSFYMRILRAIYNRAVDKELTTQRYPFRHVYTGIDKTIRRAISITAIKNIKKLDLTAKPALEFARDMFLFSFYTRGMSFIDMAYLRKSDIKRGILSYRRRKTDQQLLIKWEKCMQDIVDKYHTTDSEYLLPIIRTTCKTQARKQYLNSIRTINQHLKQIGQITNLPLPLTTYVARHSWASIAKSKNIPISIICEGMGHDSEVTTKIYLTSLDSTAIDQANSKILKSLL